MKGAGYLIATKDGFIGEAGIYYDYLLGSNGLFISAINSHIEATICIAPAEVRGLYPIIEKVRLTHGKIPKRMYELALSTFLIRPIKERFFAVAWRNGEYHLEYPEQEGNPGGVSYSVLDNVVMDIHSHGSMPAGFSGTDDRDEQGFKLSLVLGKVEEEPEYCLRVSVYGYFKELDFEEVFDCTTSKTSLPPREPVSPGQPSSWDAAEQAAMSRRGLQGFLTKMRRLFW